MNSGMILMGLGAKNEHRTLSLCFIHSEPGSLRCTREMGTGGVVGIG